MYFLSFILKNLLRRPVRTALTVLGLAVTVGSMIAFLAISHNVQVSAEQAVQGFDLQVMQAGKSSGLNSDFSEELVEATRRLPGVAQVAEGVADMADLRRESGAVDAVLVLGWKRTNFGFEDMKMLSGRKFEPGERHVILLGSMLAQNLKRKVGDKLVLGGDTDRPYEVIGVFETPHIFERGAAVVPMEDAQVITGKKGRVTGFSVRVRKASAGDTAAVDRVREEIEALKDPDDSTVRLSAQDPDAFVNSLQQLKLLRAVSWLITVIALAIGVISMLNTMAMSVLERTQEIGILRAVGWPPARVMRMILGEAAALALASAAGGTAIAFVGMQGLTLSPKVNGFIEPHIHWTVVATGTGLTLLIGIIGGAYPAFRAARLLPTEALRHD
jgi:putative ABC transport system permease protein